MQAISTFTSLLFAFILVLPLSAQDRQLFIPAEIRQAYDAGTRSYDGKPGSTYWHNTTDYTIEVTLDPENKKLTGSEQVVYYNNSPSELSNLVVRLYYDAYKKGNPRASAVNPDDITDGVELSRLTINGVEYDLNNRQQVSRSSTNLYLQLREPLATGEQLTMEVDWVQYLPLTNRRTGVYDETTFFVAYWYPQIAVYDDVFGWDDLDYSFRTEFYNNLGNYDVTINAPEQFSVWATGTLQNAEEVLPAAVHERWERAKTSTETVNVITAEDLESDYLNRSGSWRYTAEDVPDFAFATSDHYLWDAAAQAVDGRQVLISTVFPDDNADAYAEVTALQQKTMRHFSEDIPGIPYPYPAFTTFIGLNGGGMEFPMMANNAGPGRGVTIHEMFHTYFPMYVRVNERRYAWMDEGWADYITSLVTARFFDDNQEPLFSDFKAQVEGILGTTSDLPLITSSQFMDNTNYGYASYPLPAFVYSMLHHHLGDELFLRCYREYIRRWAYKSPTPYDFFYTFEDVSGQDLTWFWEPWFFEYGYPDIVVESLKKNKLTVANRGNRPVPLRVDVNYKDGRTEELLAGASVWNEGDTYEMKLPKGDLASLSVNAGVPDGASLDNFYPPLTEIYKKFDLPDDLTGSYRLTQAPMTVLITEKEGLLHMSIPNGSVSSYLIPKGDADFQSLDGSMQVQFTREEDSTTGMALQVFRYKLTANKE